MSPMADIRPSGATACSARKQPSASRNGTSRLPAPSSRSPRPGAAGGLPPAFARRADPAQRRSAGRTAAGAGPNRPEPSNSRQARTTTSASGSRYASSSRNFRQFADNHPGAPRRRARQTGAATPQRDIQPRKPRVKLAPAARLARDRNDLVAMLKAVALERLPPCPRLEVTRRSRRPAAPPRRNPTCRDRPTDLTDAQAPGNPPHGE